MPLKECPEGKERNPVTNRCIKACPKGQSRDSLGKCKASKPAASKAFKSMMDHVQQENIKSEESSSKKIIEKLEKKNSKANQLNSANKKMIEKLEKEIEDARVSLKKDMVLMNQLNKRVLFLNHRLEVVEDRLKACNAAR